MAKAAGAKPGKSPADDLALKAAELQEATRKVDALQAEIALLGGITNLVKTYQPDQLAQALQPSVAAINQKAVVATSAIGGRKAAIDEIIDDANAKQKKASDDAAAAADAAVKARAASIAADDALATQLKAFDDLKKQPADLKKKIDDLPNLLALAQKAEAGLDYGAMYFYLREAKSAIPDIVIKSTDHYTSDLLKAGNEWEASRRKAADAKQAMTDAAKKPADAATQHAAVQAARPKDVTERLAKPKN